MFKYTICFIRKGDKLLLLNREYPLWMGCWNGVGGKLEPNETPHECAIREVFEETDIKVSDIIFKGTVTWEVDGTLAGGMYAFVAEVPEDFSYDTPRKTYEGILDWKDTTWVLNPENTGIVTNIPLFLPKMLNDDKIYEHRCFYKGKVLQGVETINLKEDEVNFK